jgi:hypothetical protein
MNKKNNMKTLPPGSQLDHEIFIAMCQEGWLIPHTVEEVLEAEREIASQTLPLPNQLSDPAALLKKAGRFLRAVRTESLSVDETVAENLSRAARNGAPLSPQIEERMRQDRAKAERSDDE